jgi:hypothetical protein
VTAGIIRLRREQLTWREADGEIVLLDERTWTYLSVRGAGRALWPSVVAGVAPGELATRLVEHFAIDGAQAMHDAERFIAMLRGYGLLED